MGRSLWLLASLGAVGAGLFTATGYLVIWAFLWPFGLENHIGDLPFQTYIGYGVDVLTKSPQATVVLAIALALGLLRYLTRSEAGYSELYVSADTKPSFLRYVCLSIRTHGNGLFRKTLLPLLQWALIVMFILALFVTAEKYGSAMANSLIHGQDLGAVNGVSIIRRNDLKVDSTVPIRRGRSYVVVWSSREGVYATPLMPTHSATSKVSVLFIPREHLLTFSQLRQFVGRCSNCATSPASFPYELVPLAFFFVVLVYVSYRDFRWYGFASGECRTIAFSDMDTRFFTVADHLYLRERMRRGEKMRVSVVAGQQTTVYFIDPTEQDRVLMVGFAKQRLPAIMLRFEGRVRGIPSAFARLWGMAAAVRREAVRIRAKDKSDNA